MSSDFSAGNRMCFSWSSLIQFPYPLFNINSPCRILNPRKNTYTGYIRYNYCAESSFKHTLPVFHFASLKREMVKEEAQNFSLMPCDIIKTPDGERAGKQERRENIDTSNLYNIFAPIRLTLAYCQEFLGNSLYVFVHKK